MIKKWINFPFVYFLIPPYFSLMLLLLFFNIPKEFILETPYVSLAINYMDKISRQLFPKNSTTIYLDNSLDWMEQFLYIIQEEDKIPYIRNKLLNNSLQNKLGYSYKTKI